MAKHTLEDRKRALDTLQRCFPKGATVFGITRNISRSGMARTISIVSISGSKAPQGTMNASWPNWAVSVLCGYKFIDGPNTAILSKGTGFNHLEEVAGGICEALGYPHGSLSYLYL